MPTIEELFASAGIPWVELTPSQQFGAYATQQFRPRSPAREAFWEMQEPMMQQYYLAQPGLPDYGSFSDYMTQVGGTGYQPPTASELGVRAQQAAAMAGLTSGQFFQYVDPQTDYTGPPISPVTTAQIGALTPAQQLMYRQTYGTGTQAAQNQLALANLLARQRPSGGMYGGQYGRAIESAMGELSGQLLARDPSANFLDWYLQRTPISGAGGITQPSIPGAGGGTPPSSESNGTPWFESLGSLLRSRQS